MGYTIKELIALIARDDERLLDYMNELDRLIQAGKAEAWEEGFNAGEEDILSHEKSGDYDSPCIVNPYRKGQAMSDLEVAREAVAKLRGLGLTDAQIKRRFKQAVHLATVPVSDNLVTELIRITSSGKLTRADIYRLESALRRNPYRG